MSTTSMDNTTGGGRPVTSAPPPYRPIRPLAVSPRWFPKGQSFGLYEHNGRVCPNVTSILSRAHPFDRQKWVDAEPDIDHDAVAKEAAERGTAVHLAMECWLSGQDHAPAEDHLPWITPLKESLATTVKATRGVEVPVHHWVDGIGGYAGSCDGIVCTRDNRLLIVDYKTKRPGKKVWAKYEHKNRTQLAAYSLAINAAYRRQLGGNIDGTILLYAHPDKDEPTIVVTEGDELKAYQERWLDILRDWYSEHGGAVDAEQARFGLQGRPVVTDF
jgi:hypothetical protein